MLELLLKLAPALGIVGLILVVRAFAAALVIRDPLTRKQEDKLDESFREAERSEADYRAELDAYNAKYRSGSGGSSNGAGGDNSGPSGTS